MRTLVTVEDALAMPAEQYGLKVQNAVGLIRQKIAAGEFPPGMHLRQDNIAMLLGQSRVPVREAFKVLVAEQVLVHQRNRGHYVAEPTADEMADICWLRESLEAELARTVSAVTPQVLDELATINAEIESLLSTDAVWQRVELDLRFHETLWKLSGRPVLIHEVRGVAERQRPYRVLMSDQIPDRDPAATTEHREIIEALRVGDFDRFRALLSVHIARPAAMVALLREREAMPPQPS